MGGRAARAARRHARDVDLPVLPPGRVARLAGHRHEAPAQRAAPVEGDHMSRYLTNRDPGDETQAALFDPADTMPRQ